MDLTTDPPPDLVIEIDRTSGSLNKFEIYAAFGVPEIWRIVESEVQIYSLVADSYASSTHSRAFQFLSAAKLSELLQIGLTQSERAAARELRAWLAALPQS